MRSNVHATQHGLSIVELMIGIAIGLFILAGATLVLTTQLGDNRRLLLEAQVQQDLRAAAELISRDIRRAGYWGQAWRQVWPAVPPNPPWIDNPYTATTPAVLPASTTAGVTMVSTTTHSLNYSRSTDEEAAQIGTDDNAVTDDERFGFRLNADNYTIDIQLAGNGWQALTDPAVLKVTQLDFVLNATHLAMPCGVQCPVRGPNGCPLMQTTRDVTITIGAEAVHDSAVKRTLKEKVRLRNDVLNEVCAP
jgi:type IV pilus assembly protein PilW